MKLKTLLLINSLFFSLLVQVGFFGFNIDVQSYYNSPNSAWKDSEFIGGYIATLFVNDIYLGAFCSSFICAMGFGSFLIKLPKSFIGKIHDKYFSLLLIHFLFLLSWPIFVGSTNSLRQCISLGFIFFLISNLLKENKNIGLIILISCFAWFSHRFGKFNLLIVYFAYLSNYFSSNLNFTNKTTYALNFLVIIILITFSDFFGLFNHGDSYVTGFDLLIPLYTIFSISFIFVFFITPNNLNERFFILIFMSLIISTSVFFGNSILYERINWLTFIMSIFIFGSLLNYLTNFDLRMYIILILLLLSSLTLYIQINDNNYIQINDNKPLKDFKIKRQFKT